MCIILMWLDTNVLDWQTQQSTTWSRQKHMCVQTPTFMIASDVPNHDLSISGPRGKYMFIPLTERHRFETAGVPLEDCQPAASRHIPQCSCLVTCSGHYPRLGVRPRQVKDGVVVSWPFWEIQRTSIDIKSSLITDFKLSDHKSNLI